MNDLFEAFGINWHLLIAQAVNFGIVLVALTYFLYKPVLRVLEERRQVVAQGVEDAKLASKKLASADADAAKTVAIADKKADEILKTARADASEDRAKMLREAEARAAHIAKDAEAQAQEAKERARRESEKEVARLALLAAEKILRAKT